MVKNFKAAATGRDHTTYSDILSLLMTTYCTNTPFTYSYPYTLLPCTQLCLHSLSCPCSIHLPQRYRRLNCRVPSVTGISPFSSHVHQTHVHPLGSIANAPSSVAPCPTHSSDSHSCLCALQCLVQASTFDTCRNRDNVTSTSFTFVPIGRAHSLGGNSCPI